MFFFYLLVSALCFLFASVSNIIFIYLCLILCLLLSNSVISKLFSPPRDYAIKINLMGVLLFHSMVFYGNFMVISAYFKVCNNDDRSMTSSIVSLLYLLLYSLWSQLSKHYFLKPLIRSFCFLSICHAIR